MSVSLTTFTKHLDYVLKHYHVISLQKLVQSLNDGNLPLSSVAISFDDGFADNFYCAYPLLKEHNIPATIFLSTDCIGNEKPIWIQKLCYLINTFGVKKVIETMNGLEKDVAIVNSQSVVDSDKDLHTAVEDYLAYSLTISKRENILDKLYQAFDVSSKDVFSKNNVFLNWSQIKQMHEDGIDFGNHGKTHSPLSALSQKEQAKEIRYSKGMIEDNLKSDFIPFAYPFGQLKDFSIETKEIIRNSGHSSILTAMPTLIHRDSSPFELGRIPIYSVPVYRLAFELEKGIFKSLFATS
jgi:peptidoglycan/xylan/chitin deacetylase (PgdA/CDA1 family)